MSIARCFVCGDGWNDDFSSRLVDEHDPARWVRVVVCARCWQSARSLETARLRETERARLAAWTATREERTG